VTKRSTRIDLLRAIAVLLVIVFHYEPAPTSGPLTVWARGGWIGVDLFFVLSGFLVSGLLFQDYQHSGRIRAGRFLLRRGMKIYPAFWVLILVSALTFGRLATPGAYLRELAFVQNYVPAIWAHTWSLAVEEHFYLLLCLTFVYLSRRRASDPFAGLIPGIGGLCVAVLIARTWTVLALWPHLRVHDYLLPTHLRLDALACGVGLAYLYHVHRSALIDWAQPRRGQLLAMGLALVWPPFLWPPMTHWLIPSVGLTAIYLGCAAILLAFLTWPEPTHPIWRGFAAVGARSYSIYLWHPAVNLVLSDVLREHPLAYQIGYPVAAIGIGTLMAHLVEDPILRLRDRYWPGRPAVTAGAAATNASLAQSVA
jgi:peptidoglycan/LPS O-acetylase OafA/YrhL